MEKEIIVSIIRLLTKEETIKLTNFIKALIAQRPV